MVIPFEGGNLATGEYRWQLSVASQQMQPEPSKLVFALEGCHALGLYRAQKEHVSVQGGGWKGWGWAARGFSQTVLVGVGRSSFLQHASRSQAHGLEPSSLDPSTHLKTRETSRQRQRIHHSSRSPRA